jgi:hypothetical protein
MFPSYAKVGLFYILDSILAVDIFIYVFLFVYVLFMTLSMVHAVAQWLRHCATNGKVAESIPDGVIGIFHGHNRSGRAMALGSTQPLTEMSTRNISWG